MADCPANTPSAAWDHLVAQRDTLIHNQNQDDRLAAVEEHLLNLAAPDLSAVKLKLSLLWTVSCTGSTTSPVRNS